MREKLSKLARYAVILLWPASVWILAHEYYGSRIEGSEVELAYMKDKIAEIDDDLGEVKNLKKIRRSLIERMDVIQDLVYRSSEITRSFSVLTNFEETIFLDSFKYTAKENNLELAGRFDSDAGVIELANELTLFGYEDVDYGINDDHFTLTARIFKAHEPD